MAGNTERFQQAMNKGHSAAWDQAWNEAADFYRQALEEFPDNTKALTSLGLALYQLQANEEALKVYRQAAAISPSDPMPLEKVAEIYEKMNNLNQAAETLLAVAELYARARDINKAIEAWSNVIIIKPESVLARSRLALVYEHLGRKQQAVNEYLVVASLFQHGGEVHKAVQAVTHAIQLVPESAEANQALAMLKMGQLLPKPPRARGMTGPLPTSAPQQIEAPKEARDANLDPIAEAKHKALATLAGIVFEETSEDQETQAARRGLGAIVKGTGMLSVQSDHTKIMLHLSQAVDLQSRDETAKVVGELERAIEAGLDHAAAYYDLGLLLSSGERLESAARNLQRSVRHPDFAMGSRLLLGQIHEKMGRTKEATIEYLEALKIADSMLIPSGQADELRQLYEPIIEAQNIQSNTDVQKRLCENIAGLLIRSKWQEQVDRARQQLPKGGDGSPPMPLAEFLTEARSSQVVESIAHIHQMARAGQYRTAMEEAFHALQFAPTYLSLHIYMGDLLIQQNRIPEAVEKFTVVAQSYSVRGESKRSSDLLRRVIDLSPMDMRARNRLIEQLMAQGRPDEAIGEYLKLADVYYSLADLAMARKTYQLALKLAQEANVNKAWKVKVLHRMADIDLQSLDWRQALRVFEQIRNFQPDDEKARAASIDLNLRLGQEAQAMVELDNYAAFLVNNKQSEQALRFVEHFVSENTRLPGPRRRLADLLRQSGRIAEAIEQLDIAGDILLEKGDKASAIETVMAILALNPPNAIEYQAVLTRLRQG